MGKKGVSVPVNGRWDLQGLLCDWRPGTRACALTIVMAPPSTSGPGAAGPLSPVAQVALKVACGLLLWTTALYKIHLTLAAGRFSAPAPRHDDAVPSRGPAAAPVYVQPAQQLGAAGTGDTTTTTQTTHAPFFQGPAEVAMLQKWWRCGDAAKDTSSATCAGATGDGRLDVTFDEISRRCAADACCAGFEHSQDGHYRPVTDVGYGEMKDDSTWSSWRKVGGNPRTEVCPAVPAANAKYLARPLHTLPAPGSNIPSASYRDHAIAIIGNQKYSDVLISCASGIRNAGQWKGTVFAVVGPDLTECVRRRLVNEFNVTIIEQKWALAQAPELSMSPRNFGRTYQWPSFHNAKFDILLDPRIRKYKSISYMDADVVTLGPFAWLITNASLLFDPTYSNPDPDAPEDTTICAVIPAEHDITETKWYHRLKNYDRNFCAYPHRGLGANGKCATLASATARATFNWEYPDTKHPMLQTNYMLIDLGCLPSIEETRKLLDSYVAKKYHLLSIYYEQGLIQLPFWGHIAPFRHNDFKAHVYHSGGQKRLANHKGPSCG